MSTLYEIGVKTQRPVGESVRVRLTKPARPARIRGIDCIHGDAILWEAGCLNAAVEKKRIRYTQTPFLQGYMTIKGNENTYEGIHSSVEVSFMRTHRSSSPKMLLSVVAVVLMLLSPTLVHAQETPHTLWLEAEDAETNFEGFSRTNMGREELL